MDKKSQQSTSSVEKEHEEKSTAPLSPSVTPCEPKTLTTTSFSAPPLEETSKSTADNLGTSRCPVQPPQPIMPMNLIENSSGTIDIHHDIHPRIKLLFNCWWETKGFGMAQKEEHMFFCKLDNNDGWVVVPFDSMIPRSDLFYVEENGVSPMWFSPLGYPPFGSYYAMVIPNSQVVNINKGRPHPRWAYYKARVLEELEIDLPPPPSKKLHL
jgi:hypothetical protein